MKRNIVKTKSGAAAFYVVIFTTLLLSVIVLSFIRIMLSEANKSSNNDLSNSAYDSALAGVEDAKIALVRYHQCLDQGYSADSSAADGSCQKIIWAMQNAAATGDCDVISKILGRNNYAGGEVIVQESSAADTSATMDQAYTCVKISEELDDYRSNVSSSNRVRIIPLRATDMDKVTGVAINWFSNGSTHSGYNATSSKLPTKSNYISSRYIPIIGLDFFQTDQTFTLGQLSINNGNIGTDHVSVLLQPNSSSGTTRLSSSTLLDASDKSDNYPLSVNCNNSGEFKCQAVFQFPAPFSGGKRSIANSLLRIELPYGDTDADFSITLCTGTDLNSLCNSTTRFVGVQAQIDSTGRANDVYRRVDSRIELVDTNFPYPEFAVQLSGTSGETISKDFWVTNNCWRSSEDNGAEYCDDSGTASTGF